MFGDGDIVEDVVLLECDGGKLYQGYFFFYRNALGIVEEEMRGKHRNQPKIPDETCVRIREHINVFPRVEGHYVRKQSQRVSRNKH